MAIIEDTVIDDAGKKVIVRMEVPDTSVDDPEYERITRGGAGDVSVRAKNAFKDSMQLIHTCTTQISTTVHKIPPALRPKDFEVQFSIKVDGKVGAFIAQSTAGAQLQVTLKWGEKEEK